MRASLSSIGNGKSKYMLPLCGGGWGMPLLPELRRQSSQESLTLVSSKTSPVSRASSRAAGNTQRNPVLKQTNERTNEQTEYGINWISMEWNAVKIPNSLWSPFSTATPTEDPLLNSTFCLFATDAAPSLLSDFPCSESAETSPAVRRLLAWLEAPGKGKIIIVKMALAMLSLCNCTLWGKYVHSLISGDRGGIQSWESHILHFISGLYK